VLLPTAERVAYHAHDDSGMHHAARICRRSCSCC
jgi:hypothetical protein